MHDFDKIRKEVEILEKELEQKPKIINVPKPKPVKKSKKIKNFKKLKKSKKPR